MDAEQWITLELECHRQATQCSVHAAAVAEPVRRKQVQTLEPLVPRRGQQPLECCPVG